MIAESYPAVSRVTEASRENEAMVALELRFALDELMAGRGYDSEAPDPPTFRVPATSFLARARRG